MILFLKCLVFFFLIGVPKASADTSFDFILETGAVWQNRNDIQIPSATGTRLEVDRFNKGPFLHYRTEAFYRLGKHHAIRGLIAPFRVTVSGRSTQPVNFNGTTFSNASDLSVTYQFNSYRLSYLYAIWGFGDDQLNVGFTAKARDANITFSQAGTNSQTNSNFGFVPLIYFEYQKALTSQWILNFQMDAAAAPQGRAIDAAIKLRRNIAKQTSLALGYRTLEGGADNDTVFTFSWFNYGLIELKSSF